jgi:hypothetical protein
MRTTKMNPRRMMSEFLIISCLVELHGVSSKVKDLEMDGGAQNCNVQQYPKEYQSQRLDRTDEGNNNNNPNMSCGLRGWTELRRIRVILDYRKVLRM